MKAEGHAGNVIAGNNIICAASTVLLRSAYRALSLKSGIKTDITAEIEGELYFRIIDYRVDHAEWLKGITDYLITGLKDLESEFPDSVRIVKDLSENDSIRSQ